MWVTHMIARQHAPRRGADATPNGSRGSQWRERAAGLAAPRTALYHPSRDFSPAVPQEDPTLKRVAPVLALAATLLAAFATCALAANPPAAPAVVDSLALLERAVAKDSTDFDQLYRLGVLYMDRDRISEASRVLYKAHRLRPADVHTLVNLGVSYDAGGRPVDAQGFYDQALKLAPGDSVALCRKASSIYGQGNYAAAMDILREVVRTKPTAYCAYFTLGVAFADAGLYRDAIRMWRKVVDLAPASADAISARESIEVLEKYLNQSGGR